MKKESIETYSTELFREKFMRPGGELGAMLKNEFGKFFITRVEEMFKLIKLPVPPNRSTTHTLIYLTEGEAIMDIGSETFRIGKDECLFVPAGQVFSFSNLDRNKGFICKFHNDFIVGKFGRNDPLKMFAFLTIWGNPRVKLDGQVSSCVYFLLNRMYAAYVSNGLTQSAILQSYLIALLCEVNELYSPLTASNNVQAVNIVNAFKEALFAHVRTKHSVADYARMLHITPNHLNKTVKQLTGKTPTRWIDETLLLEAKVLLFQTGYTIGQVAEEIGMDDPSYFSRLFKKYEGVTPLAFRKMMQTS